VRKNPALADAAGGRALKSVTVEGLDTIVGHSLRQDKAPNVAKSGYFLYEVGKAGDTSHVTSFASSALLPCLYCCPGLSRHNRNLTVVPAQNVPVIVP
jgi:hypothetical protein